MAEPAWLTEARKHLGAREVPGVRHEPRILAWWRAIKRGGIKDDETPWCAAFVGAMLEAVGIVSTRFEGAASYRTWGQPLDRPAVGAICVLSRPGGAHVAFVAGIDAKGRLLLLGGNQGDAVSLAAFPADRTAGAVFRWPQAVPLPEPALLPVLASAETSRSEA